MPNLNFAFFRAMLLCISPKTTTFARHLTQKVVYMGTALGNFVTMWVHKRSFILLPFCGIFATSCSFPISRQFLTLPDNCYLYIAWLFVMHHSYYCVFFHNIIPSRYSEMFNPSRHGVPIHFETSDFIISANILSCQSRVKCMRLVCD